MTRRRWTLRFAACLGVLTVLISGCTEKQQANETLPSASKTSASESSDTLPPLGPEDFPMPEEARTKDAGGANAFVRYYVELTNHLLDNLESQPLRDLSSGCETCSRLADGYDADRKAGYRYQGGRLTVASAGAPSLTGDRAEIAFVLHQEAVTVLDRSGKPVPMKSADAYNLSGGASLIWDGKRSSWIVLSLTAEPQ